ncbi:MAG: hypothetical protein HY617_00220 [Candidatus Sungbacteria bacterium]|nr:hypothetical protein [Candidatus Sungbacteria bacterium]
MVPDNIKTFFAACILAILIAAQIMAPLSAYAQLPPVKTGTNKLENLWDTITSTDWLLKNVGEPVVRAVLRAAITSLTQEVVNWISADGGNNVGFIGNFEKTLTNELDDRAGEFLQRLDVIDFCGNIGAYLKLNLRMPAGGLRQRAKCSLSAIVSNVQNFYDNFQNGGWEAFLKTNVDIQNNTAGAFLLTLDAKIAAETKRKEEFGARYQKSAILGISQQEKVECWPRGDKPPAPPSGYIRRGGKEIAGGADDGSICMKSYFEQTPGSVIEQTLKDVNKTGIDLGVNAKFIDEMVVAPIISALLNRTMTAAHGIFGQSPNASISYGDPGLFDGYQEIGPSRDSLRSRSDAAMFTVQGAVTVTTDRALALRKEKAGASPDRRLEIAQQTEDMLGKNQTLLTEYGAVADAKLSSYTTWSQNDIEQVDDQISQTLNRVEPIAADLGSSPSASPTGDLKTDTLASITGSRAQLASHVALVRQAITEVAAAIGGLSTSSIVANQTLFITQANSLSIEISALAGDVSGEQSRMSFLRQRILSSDAVRLIDDLKPRQNNIISTAEKTSEELNDFANALGRDQEQINSLKAKLVNPADGALLDTISVKAASIIAEVKQLAAEISKLAADVSAEQTQTNALQEKLQAPETARLIGRLQGQTNIIAEGDKINARISSLTDTVAEEKAQVGVLRQQLTSSQAGQLITDITILTDAIATEQAQISTLRQQLVSAESGQLISQISQLTDMIADEQAPVSVLRQGLKTGTPAELNNQISELTDTIATEQAQISTLRQQLELTTDAPTIQQIQASITGLLTDIQAKQFQIGTLRIQLNTTAGAVNTQIAALLGDIQTKQSQISTLRRQLVAIGDAVNVQISNLLADILIKQSRISTLRAQLLAIGGAINNEIAGLLSDILIKQALIRTLREDLITIRDLGRFAADIAANQSRIIPVPDQIRAKISKVIDELKAKQIDIKNLMQRLLTLPQTDLETQREVQLENYMELLTSPGSSEVGALEALQETDKRLRTSNDRLSRVTTMAEVTAEVGSSMGSIKNASDIQQQASQTMQAVFKFLDNL